MHTSLSPPTFIAKVQMQKRLSDFALMHIKLATT